jgi:7-carboxy-7-deazaguanine synthase
MQKNTDYFLSEYFQSIQGEGNYSGVNSLFIRFYYCNLSCTWCDSKYAWLGNHPENLTFSAESLKSIIAGSSAPHIIFTGGEPTLYALDKLVVPGKKFHVETNGSFIPEKPLDLSLKNNLRIQREGMDLEIIRNFNWVISPKLSNSRQTLNDESMHYWSDKDYCIFKFIIRTQSDIDEVESVIEKFKIQKTKVYLGLEGQTLESQLQPLLVEEFIKRGFNYSPRLHVLLWGNKRGV